MARNSFQTPNLAQPDAGSQAIAVPLDFTLSPNIIVDITAEFLDGVIDFVQSVYIDNADNPAPVDLIFTGAPKNQRIRAQAFSQGWYPVSWPKGAGRLTAASSQGQVIQAIFANYAMPYLTWGPAPGVTVVPPLTNIPINVVPLGAGSNTPLVGGVALQTTKLYRGIFSVDAPTVLKWTSGAGGAVLFTAQLTAGGSVFFQPSGINWFVTAPGADLTLNSSAACNLYGGFGYVQS